MLLKGPHSESQAARGSLNFFAPEFLFWLWDITPPLWLSLMALICLVSSEHRLLQEVGYFYLCVYVLPCKELLHAIQLVWCKCIVTANPGQTTRVHVKNTAWHESLLSSVLSNSTPWPTLLYQSPHQLLGGLVAVLQLGWAGRREYQPAHRQPWTTRENEVLTAMVAQSTIWTPVEGTVNCFWFSGNISDKLSTPAIGFYQLILVTFSKLCSKGKGQET